MNLRFIVSLVFIVSTFVSTSGYTSDITFTVGTTSWYNRYVPISRIEGTDSPGASYGLMYGPVVNVGSQEWNVVAQYLLSSGDYDIISPNTLVKVHHADADSQATRRDIDVILSHTISRNTSLTVGYKGIFVDDNISLTYSDKKSSARRSEIYNNGTMGIRGTIPLFQKVILTTNGYGIAGKFHNDVTYPPGYKRLNEAPYNAFAWGAGADAKITYSITHGLLAEVGMKFQYIKSGSDNSNFGGPTVGIAYRF